MNHKQNNKDMKKRLLSFILFVVAVMSALNVQAENVIKMTTTKATGEIISLGIKATGAVTISGVKETTVDTTGNTVTYTLTGQDITITGDVTILDCHENQLTALDVGNNTGLTALYCYHNQIKGAAMTALINSLPTRSSGAEGLLSIYYPIETDEGNVCWTTQVEAAKAKHWFVTDVLLKEPYVGSVPTIKLTTAKAANSTISLGITANDAVTISGVEGNIFDNTGKVTEYTLTGQNVIITGDVTTLDCHGNQLKALVVDGSVVDLTALNCYGNQLVGPPMTDLITSLPTWSNDAKGTLKVIDTSDANEGNICYTTQVDAAKAKYWNVTDANGNTYTGSLPTIKMTTAKTAGSTISLGIKATGAVTISGVKETTFDTTGNTVTYTLTGQDITITGGVTMINCNGNNITSLDVSNNTNLTSLFCDNNQLTALDVRQNTALTTLYCGGNQLTVLDVSNNAGLENLGCNNNQLTVLDVSNNTKLTQLICSANLFTTLDMSKNTAVNKLTCYYNSNLKKVTISNSDLTNYVFTGCSSLTTMVLTSTTVPTINAKQFDEFTNLNFYVKDGKYSYVTSADNGSTIVNAYKTATNWSTYADRIYPYLPKTVTAAKIATLYLPYEVAILEGIKAYYCAGISNGKMQLTQFADGVIPAGTPAILTSDAATVADMLGDGVNSTAPSSASTLLKGASADITNETGTYLTLGESSEAAGTYGFYTYKGTTIAANTCYILASSLNPSAKGFTLSFDGGTTAIDAITDQTAADVNGATKVYYDLQGRRVQNPTKGIYIVNGKKVVINQ